MTVEQLDKISAQRLEDVDIDTLVEVNSIKYADGMPLEKKVAGMPRHRLFSPFPALVL